MSTRGRCAGAALLMMLACQPLFARHLEFTLHKQGDGAGETLLVIGGIQGDEPGGFNAAALLATRYEITEGNLWVVPNLNFTRIVRRSRGIHGDMNRKFATLAPDDPEFQAIERIKQIILADQVDTILNLHDGSGFYRPTYQDKLHSPKRWGQCVVIDQERFDGPRYPELDRIAQGVVRRVNDRLHKQEHVFHVKNTRTPEGNTEMAKTLTWFAVKNGKAAFGLESSKKLPTHLRAYYHLLAVEAYLQMMGIQYIRGFELSPEGVKAAINDNVQIALYDSRIFLDVTNARKHLRFVPLKRDQRIDYEATNPLLAITRKGSAYKVSYGNRRMTYLHPEYFEHDDSIDGVSLLVDGRRVRASIGTVVDVVDRFMVEPIGQYRVNVIGWRRKGKKNESGVTVHRKDLSRRFSIDRDGRFFRVEFYRGAKFSGMLLAKFVPPDEGRRSTEEKRAALPSGPPRDG